MSVTARVRRPCFDRTMIQHGHSGPGPRMILVRVLSAFTRFRLFESDHHAIRAKRQLKSLAPRIQFHGDAISVA